MLGSGPQPAQQGLLSRAPAQQSWDVEGTCCMHEWDGHSLPTDISLHMLGKSLKCFLLVLVVSR